MKKSKLFKTISFSSLALLMGAAGVFAFAPLGAGAQGGAIASASKIDQINTKADGENIKYAPSPLGLDPETDPVIYTTESGLEIKFGGVSPSGKYTSGTFNGYPYFTMGTYSNKAVNWIIVGTATDVELLLNKSVEHLFSTWKANYNASGMTDVPGYGTYFFGNTYETSTPAGSAINSVVASKSKIIDKIKYNKPKANSEIQSGCVLALSECCLGTSVFNATQSNTTDRTTYGRGSLYRYQSDNSNQNTWDNKTNGNLYTAINNLYNTTLGFSTEQKNLIKPQYLKTVYGATTGVSPWYDNLSLYNDTETLHYLFPLEGSKLHYPPQSEFDTANFQISSYLNTQALRIAYSIGTTSTSYYWTRTGWLKELALAIMPDGGDTDTWAECGTGVTSLYGVRPAMVITYS